MAKPRPRSDGDRVPGLRAAMILMAEDHIQARAGRTDSAAQHMRARYAMLIDHLESEESVRFQRMNVPASYRRKLPAGTGADWYVVGPDDQVIIEERGGRQ